MLLTKQHVTPSDPYELADRLYPKLAKQIRAALDALADSSIEQIEIPESVQEALRNIYAQIAAATAQEAAPLVGVAFNSVNPRVVSWAERHVGNLITAITEESKQAIRDAITESLRQGLGAQPVARTLRPFLGLNGPQARALARFAGAFGPEPTVTQQRLIDRRARRMLRQRAETVARTELITAANMGQQVTWDTAADEGLIPRSALKEWVAAEDDRTCPYCMAMDGTRVGYNDDYTVPTRFDSDGGVLTSVASKTPPAHPRCRCAMILVETVAPLESVQGGDEASTIDFNPERFGVKLPKDSERRRAIVEGFDALNDLDPEAARVYEQRLLEFKDIKINYATERQKSVNTLGLVEQDSDWDGLVPGTRTMTLQGMRRTDAHIQWSDELRQFKRKNKLKGAWREWEAAHPEPTRWRPATPDEFANVLAHELGHANDYAMRELGRGVGPRTSSTSGVGLPQNLRDKYWEMAYGNPHWKTEGGTKSAVYTYGLQNNAEMVAELHKFYLRGVSPSGNPELDVDLVPLSAAEWRAKNPELAQWVKDTWFS